MTTTVPSMAETIRLLRQADLPCKVVVGGAVLTSGRCLTDRGGPVLSRRHGDRAVCQGNFRAVKKRIVKLSTIFRAEALKFANYTKLV